MASLHGILVSTTSSPAAVVVVPPFYDPVNLEQLTELLAEIHDASKLPIMYYNIPSASGLTLSPTEIASLSKVGVKYLKDTFWQYTGLNGAGVQAVGSG
ncbi:hypothetical protein BJX76DRAFT_354678 [Aspergillus varians]